MFKSVINQLNDIHFDKRQNLYMYDSIMRDLKFIAHSKLIEKTVCNWIQHNSHLPENSRSYCIFLHEDPFDYDWKTDEHQIMDNFHYKDILNNFLNNFV
jgi:hypothetical protein